MRIFLCTQIADEARHVRFFNRFYEEVGVLESDNLQDRLAETSEHLNPQFNVLFDEQLKGRVDHLARKPEDLEMLVEAITLYHMIIEGMLALTGQHFIIEYNEERARCRGSSRASTTSPATSTATWPSARASCATWRRRTTRYRDAIQRTLVGVRARRPTACSAALVRRGRARGVRLHDRGDAGLRDEGAGAPAEGHRAGAAPTARLEDPAAERHVGSGRSRITLPSSSGAPSTSTSDMTGPIWRGGKFTTATTSRPSRSSRA